MSHRHILNLVIYIYLFVGQDIYLRSPQEN